MLRRRRADYARLRCRPSAGIFPAFSGGRKPGPGSRRCRRSPSPLAAPAKPHNTLPRCAGRLSAVISSTSQATRAPCLLSRYGPTIAGVAAAGWTASPGQPDSAQAQGFVRDPDRDRPFSAGSAAWRAGRASERTPRFFQHALGCAKPQPCASRPAELGRLCGASRRSLARPSRNPGQPKLCVCETCRLRPQRSRDRRLAPNGALPKASRRRTYRPI
jgi:hypothetical protein